MLVRSDCARVGSCGEMGRVDGVLLRGKNEPRDIDRGQDDSGQLPPKSVCGEIATA